MKLSVEVTEAEQAKLAEAAHRLDVSAEQLAAAAVQDLLGQRDADFERAAARVLENNREPYRPSPGQPRLGSSSNPSPTDQNCKEPETCKPNNVKSCSGH